MLGVGLISEIIVLLIFDVAMFAHGHIPWAAINPVNAFKALPASPGIVGGAIGVGLFFAFWSWVGFEMAPNYGEESRDPKRNVPRALYISVIGLGIFYILTSWAPFAGYSSVHAAAKVAIGNPALYYIGPANAIAGHWVGSLLSFLIITGSFACGMAFHNTTARYAYSLGREGLLPRQLGKTHPRWHSPHIASISQSVVAALIVIGFALFTGSHDPASQAYLQLYGLMAVMGVIVILAVQALVSISIVLYFRRHHEAEVHWWKTMIAPALAFISQGFVVFLLFDNISFLGSGYGYAKWLGPIDLVVVLAASDSPSGSRTASPPSTSRLAGSSTKGYEHAGSAAAARPPLGIPPSGGRGSGSRGPSRGGQQLLRSPSRCRLAAGQGSS